jgi:DNA-binding winged helix-turn-helix (wHTH) protein
MPARPQLPRVLRFGVFELDVRAGELRRSGVKLRLQEQPFQVLCMLLEHPGELVTREELRDRLWPADTFVDFDHGVNAAIKRLRDALRDSAENPRFVETLQRRGYRFMGTIDAQPNGYSLVAEGRSHTKQTGLD